LRIRLSNNNFEELPTQAAHLFTVNDIAYHPNGKFFATASRDKTIRIWDAVSFVLLKVIDSIRNAGHLKSVNRLLWVDDVLISCSDDRSIIAWEVKD
jgi:WD40 repeat protein